MKALSIIVFLGLAACTSSTATVVAPGRPEPRAMVAPTRSELECTDLVAKVRASPDSFAPAAPQLRGFHVPPLEKVPRGWAGRDLKVIVLVDAHGSVLPDSTRIDPALPAGSYDRAVRANVADWTFFPAVHEGCAVPGRATVTLTLPNR